MGGQGEATSNRWRPGVGRWAIIALATGFLAHHLLALFSESINWDEFGLFRRAADTVSSGSLEGGGRPGLAVLSLVPLVDGCTDPIRVALEARLLWTLITVAYVAGLFELLRRALRSIGPQAWHAAALGVGMLVLVPVFLRWSLQVRTDQIALACGAWGGIALLESRSRPRWAAISGVLFTLGYLSTQKLLYIAGLAIVVAAGAQWLERDFETRRELRRAALFACGAVLVAGAFYTVIPLLYDAVPSVTWQRGLSNFRFYRSAVGYRVYVGMVPSLVPHLVAGAFTVIATVTRVRRADSRRRLVLVWAIIAIGFGLGMFHADAFPYFWMTIGAFPAAAIALALPDVIGMLPSERARRSVIVGLWLLLAVPALPPALALLEDTQGVQRDAFAFVERNFAPGDRGYHIEGGLFCRREPDPLRAHVSAYAIYLVFYGERGPEATQQLIEQFRTRPVKFVIQSHRLGQLPRRFGAFLADHFVPYGPAVLVPGHSLGGRAGTGNSIDTIVPGVYRWELPTDQPPATVQVDGRRVSPGETLSLDAGAHRITLNGDVSAGILVLAVDGPSPRSSTPFYGRGALDELAGR